MVGGPSVEQLPAPEGTVRWRNLAITLLVIWIISLTDKVNIGVFIADPQFLKAIGIAGKPALAGLLATSFLLPYGIATFGWGFIIDRIGARKTLLYSTILWGVLEAAQGLVHTATAIYIIRIILGVFEASIWPASIVMTAKWFPMKERARAQSIWLNGINLGPALGLAFVTLLVVHAGWRTAFIATGLLQLVIAVPMILWLTAETPSEYRGISAGERDYILRTQKLEAEGYGKIKVPERPIGQILADHRFWLTLLTWSFDTIIFFTITTWFVAYMKSVRHLSLAGAGLFSSLSFLIAVAAMLLAGYLSDRWMRRAPISVAGYLLAALSLYLGLHAHTPLGAAVWFALTLAFKNGASTTTSTLFHNNAPAITLGGISGLQLGPSNILSAVGPWVFGIVIGLSGGFSAGFVGIIGLFVLSAISIGILALEGL